MRLARLLALCALGLSANAFATTFDSLDLYYVNSEFEAQPASGGSSSVDGDGFGAKFRGSVGDDFFFSGEYQSLSLDNDGGDYNEWRAGLGVPFGRYSEVTVYGLVEYINSEWEEADIDDDGAGFHGGILFNPAKPLSVYGQVGYLAMRESKGYEYLAGVALQIKRWGGVFAEYRMSDLELDDTDGDLEVSGYRAGVYLVVQP